MIRSEGLRRRPILARVKPAVLRWARETAGVDERAAARRAGVSLTDLQHWEDGSTLPSLRGPCRSLRGSMHGHWRPFCSLNRRLQ